MYEGTFYYDIMTFFVYGQKMTILFDIMPLLGGTNCNFFSMINLPYYVKLNNEKADEG